jgi:hypothetical protein
MSALSAASALVFLMAVPPAPSPGSGGPDPSVGQPAPIRMAIARDAARLARGAVSSSAALEAQNQRKGNWIQRHPSLFGAMVGFAGGFLIGFLPGDDAVFYDFTATFNGMVLGGIGAGAGAIVGWAVTK